MKKRRRVEKIGKCAEVPRGRSRREREREREERTTWMYGNYSGYGDTEQAKEKEKFLSRSLCHRRRQKMMNSAF